jgi:elongation factor G
MRAYVYTNDLGTDIQETEIPVEVQDLAEEYRLKLVESVAETDDGLTEKYSGGEDVTEDEIKSASVRYGERYDYPHVMWSSVVL